MKSTALIAVCVLNVMTSLSPSLSSGQTSLNPKTAGKASFAGKMPSFTRTAPGYEGTGAVSMAALINADLTRAAAQYKVLMKNTPAGQLPRTYDIKKDRVLTSDSRWWCSGFYPGTLWYIYEYTGDTIIRNEAVSRLRLLDDERYNTHDHDLGFKMYCSFGNAYRITGDTVYKSAVLTAAGSLSTRYRPSIRSIQSWDSNAHFKCPVIIDNMMNLELLEWAAHNGGEEDLGKIAVNHANTAMRNHYRPDYSSFHVVDYDLASGQPARKITWQGAADSSSWSRGQAWGLYGFTVMYRYTRDSRYLTQARHIAGYVINHPNLPADGVPYWDFNAPGIPDARRDASAGAIIASGLLELGQYTGGAERKKYIQMAERILRTLSSPAYLAADGSNGGFILRHSVGAFPQHAEVDMPLSYADYYFMEALLRYQQWYL